MTFRLAVFDFDGTLADSFPYFISVFNTLAARYRFRPVAADEVEGLRHLGAGEMMRHVGLPRWKLPFVARAFTRMMAREAGTVELFPGTEAMLGHLAGRGVRLALVSSNSRANVARVLGDATLARFDHVACGAPIFGKRRRILQTLRACGVRADEAIYIGDQPTDAQAARAAGVAFGAVTWGYAAPAALLALQPERVFEDMAALHALAA